MPLMPVDSPGVGNHSESRLLESWLSGSGEEGSRSEVPSTHRKEKNAIIKKKVYGVLVSYP